MKMHYSLPSEGILKKVLGYGYQIEPAALNILESLDDEKVIDVLDSFIDKFPDTIVIEGKQIEAIIDDFCMVHSDVEGIWDLRIKARFDAGKVRCTLIFKKDITEKSVGITLEEAKKLGEAATLARIKEALVNRNIEVAGVKLSGGNFLVKDIRRV